MRNRFVSLFLAVVFVLCASVPAGAVSPVQGWITDSDLFIGEEAAKYIAEFFVRDMIETGATCWNSETAVTKLVPLYDETGENVVSYTAELTQGYLVISAYADVPNIILEWADEAEPIYEELPLQENSKIIYAGGLDYFADQGGNTVVSVDGTAIPKQKLSCGLMELRSPDNIPAKLAEAISETKQAVSAGEAGISPLSNKYGEDIIDVYEYATNTYGGTWKYSNHANHWDEHASSARVSLFENYKGVHYYNHCGPVAITNILSMYGKKYGNSSLINKSYAEIFEKVLAASKTASPNYYINDPNGGTKGETANKFIEASFRQFGIAPGTKMKTFGPYEITYENIVNATTADRLMYVMLVGHECYGTHHLVAYAYNRIYNTQNSNLKKVFLKVCDGHVVTPRYIDASQLFSQYNTTPYWEVKFYGQFKVKQGAVTCSKWKLPKSI